MNKICRKCNEVKSFDEFPPDRRMKDGKNSWCKSCRRVYKRSERQLGLARAAKNTARDNNYEQFRKVERTRELKKYGLTLESYEMMKSKQNNCCASCKRPESSFKRSLHIDHCHTTGKVRGLLCSGCNTALGQLQENLNFIDNLKSYLVNSRSSG